MPRITLVPAAFALALLLPAAARAQQIDPTTSLVAGQFTLPAYPVRGDRTAEIWVRYDYIDYDRFGNERLIEESQEGHDFQSWDKVSWVVIEGAVKVMDRLIIGGAIPWQQTREYRSAPPNVFNSSGEDTLTVDGANFSGLGDVSVYGHYVLMDERWKIGARLGIEAPTGERDKKYYEGKKIRADSQPGSGSWDFMGGISAGVYGESWDFNLALTGVFHTRGTRGFRIGDSYKLSLGFSAELLPDDSGVQLYFTGDIWWEWRGQDEFRRHILRDSDGALWWMAPGLRFTAGPVLVQVALPWQLVNDIDEDADVEWRFVLTAGVRF